MTDGIDDIEQRLAAAAGALREHEVTTNRCRDLDARVEQVTERLAVLRAERADEQKDVERLEGASLTRLVASLRGARDDALARERAEAEVARYRVADLEAHLAATQREQAAAWARLDELATAPDTYAAVLRAKERYLRGSADPRGKRLMELADERGRLDAELRELTEAMQAAKTAYQALVGVLGRLSSASGWSTYDTFFGGGVISSAIKHSRLDEAAQAARHADRCLAVLRTELADVEGGPASPGHVAVDGLTKFVDVWFDNIFTDFTVASRIGKAKRNVSRSMELVREVRQRLQHRTSGAHERLAAVEAERQALLTNS